MRFPHLLEATSKSAEAPASAVFLPSSPPWPRSSSSRSAARTPPAAPLGSPSGRGQESAGSLDLWSTLTESFMAAATCVTGKMIAFQEAVHPISKGAQGDRWLQKPPCRSPLYSPKVAVGAVHLSRHALVQGLELGCWPPLDGPRSHHHGATVPAVKGRVAEHGARSVQKIHLLPGGLPLKMQTAHWGGKA